MKSFLIIFSVLLLTSTSYAQSDEEAVSKACMNYIEGFYEGDTTKLISCLKPKLNKYGFWKNKSTGQYESEGYMTFDEAKAYAKNVLTKKKICEF